jgi:hypothetical protein
MPPAWVDELQADRRKLTHVRTNWEPDPALGFTETPAQRTRKWKAEVKSIETACPSYGGAARSPQHLPPGAGRRPASPRNRADFRAALKEGLDSIEMASAHARPAVSREVEEMAATTRSFCKERRRLPRGTTQSIYGAATSRDWPVLPRPPPVPRPWPSARQHVEPGGNGPTPFSALRLDLDDSAPGSTGGFSPGRFPAPDSPRAGYGGIPGVRVPAEASPSLLNPPWRSQAKGPDAPFSTVSALVYLPSPSPPIEAVGDEEGTAW